MVTAAAAARSGQVVNYANIASEVGKDAREHEIDLIIEENGILHPIEIKQGAKVNLGQVASFEIMDALPDKKRGMGAIVCTVPAPMHLSDSVLAIPAWYI